MADRWKDWRRITSYPLLWIGVYACWLVFTAVLIFAWSGFPSLVQIILFVVAALVPPGLLLLSQWMERHYHPEERPR